MRRLSENSWTVSHMSPESITFDELLFRVNENHESVEKGQGCFFWADKKHISEELKYYNMDKNPDKIIFERIKVD